MPSDRVSGFSSNPSNVDQASRASIAHLARLCTFDETEPWHMPTPTVRNQVSHILAGCPLREENVARVEASIEDQVDHPRYCICIQYWMPPHFGDQ